MAATAGKFGIVPLFSLSLSLGRSSSRVTRFPLLELTGCSRVTRQRRRRPIFLPGGVNILRGSSSLSLCLARSTCHRWNASPSRVVMPSEACDISCHASRRARGSPPPTCSSLARLPLQTPEMSRNKSKPTEKEREGGERSVLPGFAAAGRSTVVRPRRNFT